MDWIRLDQRRQDKTRQGKVRRGKIRQDRTAQNRIRQDGIDRQTDKQIDRQDRSTPSNEKQSWKAGTSERKNMQNMRESRFYLFGEPYLYEQVYVYIYIYVCMCVYIYIYTHTIYVEGERDRKKQIGRQILVGSSQLGVGQFTSI